MNENDEMLGIDLTDEADLQETELNNEPESPAAGFKSFIAVNPESEKSKSANAEVIRIEETVYAHWKGVKSCCRQSRIDKNVKQLFEGWVKNKLFEYRHLQYLSYGHGGGRAKCSSSGGDWGSARKCRGSIGIKCYIEFLKNEEN